MRATQHIPQLLISFFLLSVAVSPQTPGSLDPSFNGTGKVFIPTSTRTGNRSGTIQSDGKIIWLGDNNVSGATMVRLNIDGSIDTTFGNAGVVYTNWYTAVPLTFPRGYPYDIAIQNIAGEERIVVAGSWTVPGTKKNTYTNSLRIDRFLPSGAYDTSFGTNGTLIVNNPYALAVDIDYAGRIIAVGDSGGVTRRLADGSIDTTFGPNGAGVTGAGGSMWDVKALPDGATVFAGSCASGRDTIMCVTKLKENGAVDESFGNAGRAFANFYGSGSFSRAFGLSIDGAGNIVAAGAARDASRRGSDPVSMYVAARFTASGVLDSGFNGSGKVISTVPGLAKSVHWLPGGGVVMTGTYSGPSIADFFLTSYTSLGLVDQTFGNNGYVYTDVSAQDWTQESRLWTDPSCGCTKVVVFGSSDGASYGVSFARYVLD